LGKTAPLRDSTDIARRPEVLSLLDSGGGEVEESLRIWTDWTKKNYQIICNIKNNDYL